MMQAKHNMKQIYNKNCNLQIVNIERYYFQNLYL